MWYVYIVKCSDNTLYTGITTNVEERILTHNKGKGAKYTRGRRPVVLMKYFTFANKSLASKEEYRIKQLNKKDKLRLFNN